MRYAQIVMGPAGSGKSTYCSALVKHAQDANRVINVVNLDPAAEYFAYETMIDIRDLIQVDDAMEELEFGPNGGLVFCMEYLLQNLEWLEEQLGDSEDDYILFDCPGQIELYTHLSMMKQFVTALQNLNFRVCGMFLMDSQFMVDPSKYFSGTLTALSVMINLEIPHINVLSKIDLLSKREKKQLDKYLDPNIELLLEENDLMWNPKYHQLNEVIGKLIEDYSLVRFMSLDITDPESLSGLLFSTDNAIQYGEDLDVKATKLDDMFMDPDEGMNDLEKMNMLNFD